MISKRNDTIFIVSQFFNALVFIVPIWIVYYQRRITVEQISLLVALQYLSQMIFELPTGALADIFGRKWSVVVGYALWGIVGPLVVFTQGFLPLVIAAIIAGLSDSFISGSLEALVYDSHKQDNTLRSYSSVLSRNSFWYQIGLALATATGGFLFLFWYGLPYLAYAIASVSAAILAIFFIEPKIDTERFTLQSYILQMKRGVQEAFKSKAATLMSLYYIVVAGITWPNQLYFFDFIMVELKFADDQRGIIMGAIRIMNVVMLTTLFKNNHIFTRKRSFYFFPIVMLLCFLPGVFFQGWLALPFVAGAVMAGTGRWIILTRYTNEMFDSKYRATAISALSMIVGIIYVAITSLSGPIIAAYGVRMVYTILGFLTLVTVLPLSVVLVRNRNSQNS